MGEFTTRSRRDSTPEMRGCCGLVSQHPGGKFNQSIGDWDVYMKRVYEQFSYIKEYFLDDTTDVER